MGGFRDIVMLVLGYACVPLALINPYWGLLAYCWLSFMKPQSLVWSDQVQSAQMVLAVAVAMIFRAVFSSGPRWRWKLPTAAFMAFWIWMAICSVNSPMAKQSTEFLWKFSKIGVAVVLLTGLVHTRRQLKWLIIVLAVSPGVHALLLGKLLVLQGRGTIQELVQGMDNNDLALFLAMGIPMLAYATTEVRSRAGRAGLYFLSAMGVPAVIASTSRGGMIAMSVAALLTVWRKTVWWKAVIVGAIGFTLAYSLVPETTMIRYSTIRQYQQDSSALGRIWAWRTATRMAAQNPLLGVGPGMEAFLRQYDQYKVDLDERNTPHVAHSVWFSTMAGMGYVGLGLYVALIAATLLTTRRVRRLAKAARLRGLELPAAPAPQPAAPSGPPNPLRWAQQYAVMIEIAVIAFAVGGSFLSQLGFEYVYAIYMLSVPLAAIAEEESTALIEQQGPASIQDSQPRETPRHT